jgi:hypothetical protein
MEAPRLHLLGQIARGLPQNHPRKRKSKPSLIQLARSSQILVLKLIFLFEALRAAKQSIQSESAQERREELQKDVSTRNAVLTSAKTQFRILKSVKSVYFF